MPITQYCLNHSEYPFFAWFSFLKKHTFQCLTVYVCLQNPIDTKKLTVNLKSWCFTDKSNTISNSTSLDKLEILWINMSPFFVLLKKPYLSISDGLCLLEESNRQQQACVLTQYKMIIVMKRIVKTIPTVTPTNINIWGDKCSEKRKKNL